MNYLPTEVEQRWLLEGLTALIGRRGYEPFVLQPILEPTRRFFPEHRGDSLYVLDRTSRRLMQYAGLDQYQVCLNFFSEGSVGTEIAGRSGTNRCASTAAVFFGFDGRRCHFGINRQQSADAEHLVGVMSHEVAHAYRAHHGLIVPEPEQEELLTDLTTVYLGFGILSTNNSRRFRSHSELRGGGGSYHAWGTTSSGYLPPQALSFLLGAQLLVRGASFFERRAVIRHLEPDQAAFTRAAFKFLRGKQDLGATLGIPSPGHRGPARDRGQILRPLDEYVPMAVEPDEVEAARPDEPH